MLKEGLVNIFSLKSGINFCINKPFVATYKNEKGPFKLILFKSVLKYGNLEYCEKIIIILLGYSYLKVVAAIAQKHEER